MIVGEIMPLDRDIEINSGRKTLEIEVSNVGDRPIQVGSHFHFFEVNKLLKFDREKAFGFHLNIPSGTSVRFEPGEKKCVELVEMAGKKALYGLNNLTVGRNKDDALKTAAEKGFGGDVQ